MQGGVNVSDDGPPGRHRSRAWLAGVVDQLQIPYRASRDAHDRMTFWDIRCHNCTRANCRAGPDMDAGQECCMSPKQRTGAKDGLSRHAGGRRHMGTLINACTVFDHRGGVDHGRTPDHCLGVDRCVGHNQRAGADDGARRDHGGRVDQDGEWNIIAPGVIGECEPPRVVADGNKQGRFPWPIREQIGFMTLQERNAQNIGCPGESRIAKAGHGPASTSCHVGADTTVAARTCDNQ